MRWGLAAAVEAGQWAYVCYDVTADVSPLRVYSVGTAPRTIGYVDAETVAWRVPKHPAQSRAAGMFDMLSIRCNTTPSSVGAQAHRSRSRQMG